MSFHNLDWPGCQQSVYCREARTLRYCGNRVREGQEYCGRHRPKSRLVALWQRVKQAVNGAVWRVKGMLL